MIDIGTIDALCAGRFGVIDVPCPECGPLRRSALNRRRWTLRDCHRAALEDSASDRSMSLRIGRLLTLAEDLAALDSQARRLGRRYVLAVRCLDRRYIRKQGDSGQSNESHRSKIHSAVAARATRLILAGTNISWT